jgi:hypothetical protein
MDAVLRRVDVSNPLQQGIGSGGGSGGSGGGAFGQPTSTFAAEDVIRAMERLNLALASAARAGWTIDVTLGGVEPSFTGEGPSYQQIRATISKAI